MDYPKDLKYTENDEWIRAEGNQATIGISDYAQSQLSDVVYLELSVETGKSLSQGDAIGTVESVKAAADLYTPASGTVKETNETLADMPELINTDPYGEAWMLRLDIADPSELEGLMDAAAYEAYCDERSQ